MHYHRQSEELEAAATSGNGGGGGDTVDTIDGDGDSGLMVSARMGSRVPRPLGWTQLALGALGCLFGASDAGVRAAAAGANATAVVFQLVRPVQPLDITSAFGFPIWCSLSMLLSSALALWYANTLLQRLLRLYRLYSLLNLGVQSLGCVLLVIAWISQSQPAVSPEEASPSQPQPQRALLALSSLVLIASWLLVLACVLCDWCVGKNLLQVLGIFFRTVCRRSQRDSFLELQRSTNSLNSIHLESFAARKQPPPSQQLPPPPHGFRSAAAYNRRPSLLETTWQLQLPPGDTVDAASAPTAATADEDSISRELADFANDPNEHLTGLLARHRMT